MIWLLVRLIVRLVIWLLSVLRDDIPKLSVLRVLLIEILWIGVLSQILRNCLVLTKSVIRNLVCHLIVKRIVLVKSIVVVKVLILQTCVVNLISKTIVEIVCKGLAKHLLPGFWTFRPYAALLAITLLVAFPMSEG